MKKIYIIVIALVIIILFISWRFIVNITFESNKNYVELSDEQLVELDDEYHFFLTTHKHGGNSTGVPNGRDIDYDFLIVNTGKLDGLYTLQATQMKENESVQFVIHIEMESGNGFAYLVSPDNDIIQKFNEKDNVILIDNAKEGVYLIRIIGDELKGSISVERTFK